MKIGIIGQGFVGNAIYHKFSKYYNVKTFDIDESKCNSNQIQVYEQEIIFICLPTPMKQDGSCDLSIVEKELKGINNSKEDNSKIIVIKSTVPPGTTEKWNDEYDNFDIVFNPEFLTEANSINDFETQNRIILGGSREATTKLKLLYSSIFRKTSKIIKTDSKTAELVKYLTNTFLATKLSFANEMYMLCESLNLDYDKVIEYATYDERIGMSHWGVPGPDGDKGFGGHCFPKDLSALIKLTEEIGSINNVLKATQKTNDIVRQNRDWERMKGRAVS